VRSQRDTVDGRKTDLAKTTADKGRMKVADRKFKKHANRAGDRVERVPAAASNTAAGGYNWPHRRRNQQGKEEKQNAHFKPAGDNFSRRSDAYTCRMRGK
jgi:hypothetical protein